METFLQASYYSMRAILWEGTSLGRHIGVLIEILD